MTQRELGEQLDLPNPGVRIAQYEMGVRIPRPELLERMAKVLGISPWALTQPDISSPEEFIGILFSMEEQYPLAVAEEDGIPCIRFSEQGNEQSQMLCKMLRQWDMKVGELNQGKISEQEYQDWKCHFSAES